MAAGSSPGIESCRRGKCRSPEGKTTNRVDQTGFGRVGSDQVRRTRPGEPSGRSRSGPRGEGPSETDRGVRVWRVLGRDKDKIRWWGLYLWLLLTSRKGRIWKVFHCN